MSRRVVWRGLIKGKVQGVYFRHWTQVKAREFGVCGWVRNVRSGDVEVLACASQDVLDRFVDWLWQGPELANVESVEGGEVDSDEGCEDFVIKPTF